MFWFFLCCFIFCFLFLYFIEIKFLYCIWGKVFCWFLCECVKLGLSNLWFFLLKLIGVEINGNSNFIFLDVDLFVVREMFFWFRYVIFLFNIKLMFKFFFFLSWLFWEMFVFIVFFLLWICLLLLDVIFDDFNVVCEFFFIFLLCFIVIILEEFFCLWYSLGWRFRKGFCICFMLVIIEVFLLYLLVCLVVLYWDEILVCIIFEFL